MTYEGLRLKVLKYWRVGLADWRKKQLKSTDFTIISNNCWGGMIYESYNLPKESPTVGMFFMAKEYIEFLSDLKGYIGGKLTFIKPEESRWKEMPQISGDKRFGHYPVGVLSNGKIRLRFSSYIITVSKKLVKSGSGVSNGLTGISCWLNLMIRMDVQKWR